MCLLRCCCFALLPAWVLSDYTCGRSSTARLIGCNLLLHDAKHPVFTDDAVYSFYQARTRLD